MEELPRYRTSSSIARIAQLNMNGYGWSIAGVALATACFWLARHYFDKGQASLLFLPVVIACAVRFGFGPAVSAAVFSFLCWDYYFLPPYGSLIVRDTRDWLSLFVFLGTAITTAKLAANARQQTEEAKRREDEITMLYEASKEVSDQLDPSLLLPALAAQLEKLSQSSVCVVFTKDVKSDALISPQSSSPVSDIDLAAIGDIAEESLRQNHDIGFGSSSDMWAKAISASGLIPVAATAKVRGAYVPLHAQGRRMGVLYVGPRRDGRPFSARDERLIRTLANHAAIVLARNQLAAAAAQADALREADALKDRILSLASHELRTPLAAIKASATGLLQAGVEYDIDDRREALQSISGEVDRLATLVGNMLDLSRLDAGSWKPDKDWCDLREVVGTALDRFSDEECGRIELTTSDLLWMVFADYSQLVLVITNLLSNAFKYGGEGNIEIQIDTLDENSNCLQVSVRDFGTGVAFDDAERVFERFYRSNQHQRSAVHGTGLGLSLCAAIVEAHGGKIWVEYAKPGARFVFTLPVTSD